MVGRRIVSLDVSRAHRGGDGPRQQSGYLATRLRPAASRRLARVDADGPGLPVLPVHRRRGHPAEPRPADRGGRLAAEPGGSACCGGRRSSSRWDSSSTPCRASISPRSASRACSSASPCATSSPRSSSWCAAGGRRRCSPPPRCSATGRRSRWIPVPGFATGDLGQGGQRRGVDRPHVLGPHIWRVGRVYDPEGILSTVPAIATTLFGVLVGRLVRSGLGTADTATGLFVGGAVGIGLGLAWEPWLPINKALWTGSYALFTAGAGLDGPGRGLLADRGAGVAVVDAPIRDPGRQCARRVLPARRSWRSS